MEMKISVLTIKEKKNNKFYPIFAYIIQRDP